MLAYPQANYRWCRYLQDVSTFYVGSYKATAPFENRFIIRPSGCHAGLTDRHLTLLNRIAYCLLEEGHGTVHDPFDRAL